MAEDWRVTIGTRADDDGVVARALESLHERELERDARERLGGRVAVSRDDEHIYLYAAGEAAAREAAGVVSELLGAHDLALEGVAIDRPGFELEMELAFLKKAAAYFAREHR